MSRRGRLRLPPAVLNAILRATVRPSLARVEDPEAMRMRFERRVRMMFRLPRGAGLARETLRARGREVPGARLSPQGARPGRLLLYLHGGGYVAGSHRTHAHVAARLARAARTAAFLPDYALAPERPFPAAYEDTLAAYAALAGTGARVAVAGDSAGGGLALALLAGAEAAGLPPPAAVVAYSPWVDLTGGHPSVSENAERDAMLPAFRMGDVLDLYLAGADPRDPRASPLMARFARPPPPVLLFASEDEILRDEAVAMADHLCAAGGAARLVLRPGLPHAWPAFAGWLAEADDDLEDSAAFLAAHLAGEGETEPVVGAAG